MTEVGKGARNGTFEVKVSLAFSMMVLERFSDTIPISYVVVS
jgi:hypothetical protein